jgi:uncharacterized phage-associated protein
MNRRAENNVTCFDVAKYIFAKKRYCAEKMHALLYYSQAWSLVFDRCSLFNEDICACDTGIIIPVLYKSTKYVYKDYINGDPGKLSQQQKYSIKVVLRLYKDFGLIDLVELVRLEEPWKKAWGENYNVNEDRNDGKIEIKIPYGMRSSYEKGRYKIIKPSHITRYCYRCIAEKRFLKKTLGGVK